MAILMEEAVKAFQFEGAVSGVRPFGGGHINDTFLVSTACRPYILQRINRFVFKRPQEIMENMRHVTGFLQKKIEARGGDPRRETITLIPAVDGGLFYRDTEGEYWRSMLYIENTTAYDFAASPEMLFESGYAFGSFQNLLSDFPAGTLYEVIPDFHNTAHRYRQLMEAVDKNRAGRADAVLPELAFAAARKEEAPKLMELLREGSLPLKVTHNDTKMSNVLIDNHTGKGLCVIDLDTVMPGLTAFDFGDSIRAGASTAAEDERDLTKVRFSLELYEAYTKGFLKAAGKSLTPLELDTLPLGAKLITYEIGLRFLADYLNGDVYFKTSYPEHNLHRARNQFKLVADMEGQWDKMAAVVRRYV